MYALHFATVWLKVTVCSAVLFAALTGCAEKGSEDDGRAGSESEPPATASDYVGAQACGECHADELQRWAGSHHDLAMQPAVAEFVVGEFADTKFVHNGVESSFYQRDGHYFVRSDGADGELAEFPVRYTFGIYPLQQYIVELPDGRLQALGAAWDSRPAAEGGQRWFHVYGDEPIDHTDVLHWTRMSQNWDSMCSDCHSTAIDKQFDVDTGQFETHWAEINVACEACHGPGSQHVAWATAGSRSADNGLTVSLDERREVSWLLDGETGNSKRSEPRVSNVEINTCAPCHSRRARIAETTAPVAEFLDAYVPSLPQPPLYHADGQILEEDYVYASFLQSRMYQQGVTCSDCHDPHSLQLRAPGSQVCLQCHLGDKFATSQHQLLPPESDDVVCVDCHMPETTYMQVDGRRDHSFRIPRPDLSVDYATPNACNGCHSDKSPQWSVDALAERNRLPISGAHWVDHLVAAHAAPWDSRNELLSLATDALVPAVVRATAIAQLPMDGDPATIALVGERAASSDPMLRWAVAQSLQRSHPAVIAGIGPSLLNDPVRAVRLEALSAVSQLSLELLPAETFPALNRVSDEYIAAQMVSAERPEAHVNVGNLQRNRNRLDDAEAAYRTAIRLGPEFVPAYVNLADLFRVQGRDADSEELLRTALQRVPELGQAALRHSLGLTLVRLGRLPEATEQLRIAAGAEDASPDFSLAYALAMDAQGESRTAVDELEAALIRHGQYPQLIAALVNVYQRMGDTEAATALAERMRNR